MRTYATKNLARRRRMPSKPRYAFRPTETRARPHIGAGRSIAKPPHVAGACDPPALCCGFNYLVRYRV